MAVQLDLPLEKKDSRRTVPQYKAWAKSGMKLPYEPKNRERAISMWLRSLADSMRDLSGTKHSG